MAFAYSAFSRRMAGLTEPEAGKDVDKDGEDNNAKRKDADGSYTDKQNLCFDRSIIEDESWPILYDSNRHLSTSLQKRLRTTNAEKKWEIAPVPVIHVIDKCMGYSLAVHSNREHSF